MIRPQLWVLAGPNGAGKSTFARRHIIGRIPFVNADDIARAIAPDDVNSAAIHLKAGRLAVEERERLLAASATFAFETTLTGKSELALMRRAAGAGYAVNVIFVGLRDATLSAARVRTRVALGGHDVPPDAIVRRYDRCMSALPEALAIARRAWIFDNSGRSRRLLLRRDGDAATVLAAGLPPWADRAIPPSLRTPAPPGS